MGRKPEVQHSRGSSLEDGFQRIVSLGDSETGLSAWCKNYSSSRLRVE